MLRSRDVPPHEREALLRGWYWQRIVKVLKCQHRVRNSGAIVALCVFHQEKTASLWLRPNNLYKCYGCGAQGEILDFLIELLEPFDLDDLKFKLSQFGTVDCPGQLLLSFERGPNVPF
jgi:DNA primase